MKIIVGMELYRMMHQVRPDGFGDWRFKIRGKVHWFENLSYAEAKKKAIEKAKEEKVKSICVMP